MRFLRCTNKKERNLINLGLFCRTQSTCLTCPHVSKTCAEAGAGAVYTLLKKQIASICTEAVTTRYLVVSCHSTENKFCNQDVEVLEEDGAVMTRTIYLVAANASSMNATTPLPILAACERTRALRDCNAGNGHPILSREGRL